MPRSVTLQRKSVAPHLEAAVLTALEKLPADRFATAAEFLTALGDTARRPTGIAAAVPRVSRSRRAVPWVLAVQKRLKIGDMAGIIAPYPTLSEVSKRVSGAWYMPKLFSERTRRVVQTMQWLP